MEEWIKKSDAIDVIKKNHYNIGGCGATLKVMIEQIKAIPSADRPQGEWIIDEEQGTSTCSNCGIVWQFMDGTSGSDFCPWCGARMKGAGDDTD